MATRYDVITPRKNGERTFWLKVGSAWESDKFKLKITLDTMPLPDEKGQVVIMVSEPKPRDEAPAPRQQSKGAAPADLGDDIPFGMEWR